jgi:hypothetical protein
MFNNVFFINCPTNLAKTEPVTLPSLQSARSVAREQANNDGKAALTHLLAPPHELPQPILPAKLCTLPAPREPLAQKAHLSTQEAGRLRPPIPLRLRHFSVQVQSRRRKGPICLQSIFSGIGRVWRRHHECANKNWRASLLKPFRVRSPRTPNDIAPLNKILLTMAILLE